MKLLIDGDIIRYASAWSCEDAAAEEELHIKINDRLANIFEVTGSADFTLYFTGGSNFRKGIYPEYKANRVGKPKPKWFKQSMDYMLDNFSCHISVDQEADDTMGIKQMMSKEETCICSADKDLDCIPGKHYNWSPKNYEKGVYTISDIEADRFFYTQCLTGDATDNIPGLKKMTGQIATKGRKKPILEYENFVDMYEHVSKMYGDIDWHFIPKCLWIRRKENQIWEPPTGS